MKLSEINTIIENVIASVVDEAKSKLDSLNWKEIDENATFEVRVEFIPLELRERVGGMSYKKKLTENIETTAQHFGGRLFATFTNRLELHFNKVSEVQGFRDYLEKKISENNLPIVIKKTKVQYN